MPSDTRIKAKYEDIVWLRDHFRWWKECEIRMKGKASQLNFKMDSVLSWVLGEKSIFDWDDMIKFGREYASEIKMGKFRVIGGSNENSDK